MRALAIGALTAALAAASLAQPASSSAGAGQAFVQQLRNAAAQPGGAALADLTQFPFLFDSQLRHREQFVDTVVPALFSASVRRCLQRAMPQPEEDRLVVWCKPYAFYLGPVQGRWRLIEFGVDAE